MKTQTECATPTTLGPFLRLMLALAEQRARTERESPRGGVADRSLSGVAIADAMRKVSSEKPPVCRSPIALGPFLTMILTLAERKVAEQRYQLRSSIVPANSG